MAATSRRTVSRRELGRAPRFGQVSPDVGQLDETAFAEALESDADAALELLAEMAGVADRQLRLLARRLAARVTVRLTRSGTARAAGIGRLQRARLEPGGDLDVDASLDAVVTASASGRPVEVDALRGSAWRRTSLALCLVVDRSGSVSGTRLASSAMAAAAVALRAPDDYSVVVFSDRAVVLKSQDARRPTDLVVDDVLALRGHGVTDLAAALDTARAQLARSPARRRLAVLLSDCRPTAGPDPIAYARRLEGLAVVAPADDAADAATFAAAAGARLVTLTGPADVPRALSFLSEPG